MNLSISKKTVFYSALIIGLTVGSILGSELGVYTEREQMKKHLLALEYGEFNSKSGAFQLKPKSEIIKSAGGRLDNSPEAIMKALPKLYTEQDANNANR